jgi:mRNA-degrading endonuclease toxin of MazEF toxin-antitoxin module
MTPETLSFTLSELRSVVCGDQLDLLMEIYELRKNKDSQCKEKTSGKDFNKWSKQKEILHCSPEEDYERYFSEGQIWYLSCGVNIGYEQDGKGKFFKRPFLIVKKFNKDLFWAIPLSTTTRNGKYYYSFSFQKGKISKAILSQLRLFDAKRLLKKSGKISKEDFSAIKEKLREFLL